MATAKYVNRDGELWLSLGPANGKEGWVRADLVTPTAPLANVPVWCPFAGSTNQETLVNLINAEGDAMKEKSIGSIFLAFARSAEILDGATKEKWDDAIARYLQRFPNEKHNRIEHYGYRFNISDQQATVTDQSRGEFVWLPTGDVFSYDDPSSFDNWTFVKDRNGCWVISQFKFRVHQ